MLLEEQEAKTEFELYFRLWQSACANMFKYWMAMTTFVYPKYTREKMLKSLNSF